VPELITSGLAVVVVVALLVAPPVFVAPLCWVDEVVGGSGPVGLGGVLLDDMVQNKGSSSK
jgi:hypothetical protein